MITPSSKSGDQTKAVGNGRKPVVAQPVARKAPGAFRTISEVSDELGIPQHVLRFWESKFAQIKPIKRGGGRRYYRPEDVDLLRAIQALLYDDKYTIKGAQQLIREQGVKAIIQSFGGFAGAAAQNAEYGIQTQLLTATIAAPAATAVVPENIAPLSIGPIAVLPESRGGMIAGATASELLATVGTTSGQAELQSALRDILQELEAIKLELTSARKRSSDL